jgi:hypothetical protein
MTWRYQDALGKRYTTRGKFDAIHLKKRTFVESIDYFDRPKVLPEFIRNRERKIAVRKLRESK